MKRPGSPYLAHDIPKLYLQGTNFQQSLLLINQFTFVDWLHNVLKILAKFLNILSAFTDEVRRLSFPFSLPSSAQKKWETNTLSSLIASFSTHQGSYAERGSFPSLVGVQNLLL